MTKIQQQKTGRGRIAVVRHGEYFQPHPRRDIFALRDAGFDVDIICDSEGNKPHLEHVDGVTVIRVPMRHKRGHTTRYLFEYITFPLLAAGALALRSIRRRYDYVEIDTMPTWLIVAAAVPKLLGAKIVLYMFEHMAELTASDRGLSERHWLIRLIDRIEMACVAAADTVITPAERNRELYIERGIPHDKIVFIPNCPDERLFLPEGFAFPWSGSADGGTHGNGQARPFRLVTHGSLLERYGIQILIQAVAELRQRIPEIELDIIGSGEYEPELMELARALGLADTVRFVGPVPFERMAESITGADVGVGPYLLDLLPNKMMEYLLLGIPAVAADWPTMRRYFGDDAITYVPPNDVAALVEAIDRLYRNPEERLRRARVAHEQYVNSLAWSRTRNDYLAVYGVGGGSADGKVQPSDGLAPAHQNSKARRVRAPESSHAHADDGLDSAGAFAREQKRAKRHGWLGFVLGQSRGPRNALTRLPTIVDRFGWSAVKTQAHLDSLVSVTQRHHVTPTLLATGVTAKRHPEIILELAGRGVEIGAHGFVHNDYSQLDRAEQIDQVGRARDELAALGLRVHGWRCPYSRSNQHTLDAVRLAGLEYDATPVYAWPAFEALGVDMTAGAQEDYERLCRLFGVRDAKERAVLPRLAEGLVEIPMSIPQDEDMIDRLHLKPEQVERVWLWMLSESNRLGEAFVMCLHPERAELMASALDRTLREAREVGTVWIAPLMDIAEWWRERAAAVVTVTSPEPGRALGSRKRIAASNVSRSKSAGRVSARRHQWTIAAKSSERTVVRIGDKILRGTGALEVNSDRKPIVGVSNRWPDWAKDRIQECGYLVEVSEPEAVEIYLDDEAAAEPEAAARNLAAESQRLVRVEPWPAGFRSCLSVTGDIDAITLFDFAMRLKEF